ncbi:TonB family protein [Treponema sp.]|uniref:energy transducer TonB n=1 Tax=Treponema sp. TaxID=166 RepID=UPI00298EBA01|nr:TonB family protein [Treponema sp.]MCR5612607.1 TonB family protein [Treponema sp.]
MSVLCRRYFKSIIISLVFISFIGIIALFSSSSLSNISDSGGSIKEASENISIKVVSRDKKKASIATKKYIQQNTSNANYLSHDEQEIDNSSLDSEESISSSLKQAEIDLYKNYLLSCIAKKKNFPVQARKNGQSGKVKLKLVLSPDGNLVSLEIISPCKYSILNQAAINSVKRAAPFKRIENCTSNMDFIFSLSFELK